MRLNITPLNEGQEMNYCEPFTGTVPQLRTRCNRIISGLSALLPRGTFTIAITDLTFDRYVHYNNGKFYNLQGDEIIEQNLLTT
jgi:hypothetical protein